MPKLLVLGSILDDFLCFLPRLLEIICTFAPSKHQNREGYTQGSAEKLPYEDGKFDLVTAVETVYFWPNLADCLQEVRRVLKPGGKFAILVEVIDGDSMWTNVVEGMTAYSPEELKTLLDDAGFIQTEIHRMKPSNATVIGVKA